MVHRRSWLVLPLLSLALLALGWWLFKVPAAPRNSLADDPAVEQSTAARPTQPRCRPAPSKCAPAPTHEEDAAVEEPFVDDDSLVAEQPLWKPDYGPAINGTRSVLLLHLRDARGATLDDDIRVTLQLTRLAGRYGLVETQGGFDHASGDFCARGPDGFGLEPGEYEFHASAGPYGLVTRRYNIGAGQTIDEQVELPRWRRIICLQFEDRAGQPVSELPCEPVYVSDEGEQAAPLHLAPPAVLRERVLTDPVEGPIEESRTGDSRARDEVGSSVRIRRGLRIDYIDRARTAQRHLTDGGRYYLRVFAGGPGHIELALNDDMPEGSKIELYAGADLRGNFESPAGDNFRIILDPEAGYAEAMDARPKDNTDDPGRRSLLQPRVAPAAKPFDPADASDVGENAVRLVVRLQTPARVHAWLEHTLHEDSFKQYSAGRFNLYWNEEHSCWWTDMIKGMEFAVSLNDGMFLRHTQDVRAAAEGERKVEVNITLDGRELAITPPSPTVAALATRCAAWQEGLGGEGVSMMEAGRPAVSYFCGAELPAQVCGSGKFCLGEPGCLTGVPFAFRLNKDERAQLLAGRVDCKASAAGLVLRTIGPDFSGLPSVWGVLMEADLDVTARRVRKALLNKRPAETAAAREFMGAQGAWYLTEDGPQGGRLASDAHGYLYFAGALKPGKRYVLYLWSNSRDELRPDKRIDFVASDGITDLGAVPLPGYEK